MYGLIAPWISFTPTNITTKSFLHSYQTMFMKYRLDLIAYQFYIKIKLKGKHWTRIGKKTELIHNIWTWRNTQNPWIWLPSKCLRTTPLPSIPLIPKNIYSRKFISSPQFPRHAFTLKLVSSNSPHMPSLYSIGICTLSNPIKEYKIN